MYFVGLFCCKYLEWFIFLEINYICMNREINKKKIEFIYKNLNIIYLFIIRLSVGKYLL